jgi:hypothetical protein
MKKDYEPSEVIEDHGSRALLALKNSLLSKLNHRTKEPDDNRRSQDDR